jgi:hypothetical protein
MTPFCLPLCRLIYQLFCRFLSKVAAAFSVFRRLLRRFPSRDDTYLSVALLVAFSQEMTTLACWLLCRTLGHLHWRKEDAVSVTLSLLLKIRRALSAALSITLSLLLKRRRALSAALTVTLSLLLKRRRRFVDCSVGHYVASSQETRLLSRLLCRSLCRFFTGDEAAFSAAVSVSMSLLLKRRRRFVGCFVTHYVAFSHEMTPLCRLLCR